MKVLLGKQKGKEHLENLIVDKIEAKIDHKEI
jgi:hypothetical protein